MDRFVKSTLIMTGGVVALYALTVIGVWVLAWTYDPHAGEDVDAEPDYGPLARGVDLSAQILGDD